MADYHPFYSLNSSMLHAIATISELLTEYTLKKHSPPSPMLRKKNQIKTIHASLAIEQNTLSLESVTAIINGKHVVGDVREITEVKNALTVYDMVTSLNPYSESDFLSAHNILMNNLVNNAGTYRKENVGVFKGRELVHQAPHAQKVPTMMNDLFSWLKTTKEHPLIASCVFHYGCEFIHPFIDGNGRMGRLWQHIITYHWKPLLAMIPVETIINSQQSEYYISLSQSDKRLDAAPFIEFMLAALTTAIKEELATYEKSLPEKVYQKTDQSVNVTYSQEIIAICDILKQGPMKRKDIMKKLKLSHRQTFYENYLRPAMKADLIEYTYPQTPQTPKQQYQLTEQGKEIV